MHNDYVCLAFTWPIDCKYEFNMGQRLSNNGLVFFTSSSESRFLRNARRSQCLVHRVNRAPFLQNAGYPGSCHDQCLRQYLRQYCPSSGSVASQQYPEPENPTSLQFPRPHPTAAPQTDKLSDVQSLFLTS